MLMVSSHIAMTKAILGIASAGNLARIATVTTHHDAEVQEDLEDTGDGVVIVVAQGGIPGVLGLIEGSPDAVVRDVINNR
jgi:hypothetical protein